MRKLQKLFVFVPILAMGLMANAQTRTLQGTVTAEDNAPVAAASVQIKDKTVGTFTDDEGKFSLSAPAGEFVLVISSVGYRLFERTVKADESNISISLSATNSQLSEVVVTALGITRQSKSLVYATQTIKPAQLTEVRDANNVLNSLQGKVANALITQASGGPGSGARIVLRGNRSIQGSNNALIVVDGVPITNQTNFTVTSDFGGLQGSDGASSINPDDIESMTVLRGASAAALYGSQAGNGVIVITTKKGKSGKASVTINSGLTLERPFVYPDVQNSYGQGNSGALIGTSGENWGAKLDGSTFTGIYGQRNYSAQTDNIKDFFETGKNINNSIGVSGGSEKMQTYLSYTNTMIFGMMPRNEMKRHIFNLRLSNQVSSKFSTDAKVTYIIQDVDSRYQTGEAGPLMELFQIPRNVSLSDAKNYETVDDFGVPVPAPYPVINPALYQNPYWRI